MRYEAPRRRLSFLVIGMVIGMLSMAILSGCGGKEEPPPPTLTPLPPTPTPQVVATTTALQSPLTSPLPTPKTMTTENLKGVSGRIAFHSEESGNFDIWVMDLPDGEPRQLTTAPARDIEPAWSPDGAHIVFASGRDDPENLQLYVMNADGSQAHPLLTGVRPYDNWGPAWSPDGQYIAFQTNRDVRTQGFDLYVVRADGSGEKPLVTGPGNQYHVSWSPDGKHIVYVDDTDGDGEIYVANADGSQPRKITDNLSNEAYPRWSPDGRWILFQSNRDGLWRLYIIPPEGGDFEMVSLPILANDVMGTWSPDGKYIAFSSDRAEHDWEIYLMPLHGDMWKRLTFHFPQIKDRYPAWTR